MADKMIGSLIYGDHVVPKPQRPWKQRIKIPLAVGIAAILLISAAWKFVNYREEGVVSSFLADVRGGNYDKAYANWDTNDGHYTMKDFLEDWGTAGYYGKSIATAKVSTSNAHGSAVIVYIRFDGFKAPIAFSVDKDSRKMSFSPINKYVR
jgi:hypothetical protein